MIKRILPTFIIASAAMLIGCGQRTSDTVENKVPVGAAVVNTPGASTKDIIVNLRGSDINDNGIRDDVEMSMSGMGGDMTEQIRLMAYAWSLQQGMEVVAVGSDIQIQKAAMMISDATLCVMANPKSPNIAQHVVDIYKFTSNSPERKAAWAKMQEKTHQLSLGKSDAPCAQTDTVAVLILKKTIDAAKLTMNKSTAVEPQASASKPAAPASTITLKAK